MPPKRSSKAPAKFGEVFVCPFAGPNIGRRTGIDVTAGKTIRKNKFGLEDFDDYWTDSDIDGDEISAIWKDQKENNQSLSSNVLSTKPSDFKVDPPLGHMSPFSSADSGSFVLRTLPRRHQNLPTSQLAQVDNGIKQNDSKSHTEDEEEEGQGQLVLNKDADLHPFSAEKHLSDDEDLDIKEGEESNDDGPGLIGKPTHPGQVEAQEKAVCDNTVVISTEVCAQEYVTPTEIPVPTGTKLNCIGDVEGTISRLPDAKPDDKPPSSVMQNFRTKKRLTYSSDGNEQTTSLEGLSTQDTNVKKTGNVVDCDGFMQPVAPVRKSSRGKAPCNANELGVIASLNGHTCEESEDKTDTEVASTATTVSKGLLEQNTDQYDIEGDISVTCQQLLKKGPNTTVTLQAEPQTDDDKNVEQDQPEGDQKAKDDLLSPHRFYRRSIGKAVGGCDTDRHNRTSSPQQKLKISLTQSREPVVLVDKLPLGLGGSLSNHNQGSTTRSKSNQIEELHGGKQSNILEGKDENNIKGKEELSPSKKATRGSSSQTKTRKSKRNKQKDKDKDKDKITDDPSVDTLSTRLTRGKRKQLANKISLECQKDQDNDAENNELARITRGKTKKDKTVEKSKEQIDLEACNDNESEILHNGQQHVASHVDAELEQHTEDELNNIQQNMDKPRAIDHNSQSKECIKEVLCQNLELSGSGNNLQERKTSFVMDEDHFTSEPEVQLNSSKTRQDEDSEIIVPWNMDNLDELPSCPPKIIAGHEDYEGLQIQCGEIIHDNPVSDCLDQVSSEKKQLGLFFSKSHPSEDNDEDSVGKDLLLSVNEHICSNFDSVECEDGHKGAIHENMDESSSGKCQEGNLEFHLPVQQSSAEEGNNFLAQKHPEPNACNKDEGEGIDKNEHCLEVTREILYEKIIEEPNPHKNNPDENDSGEKLKSEECNPQPSTENLRHQAQKGVVTSCDSRPLPGKALDRAESPVVEDTDFMSLKTLRRKPFSLSTVLEEDDFEVAVDLCENDSFTSKSARKISLSKMKDMKEKSDASGSPNIGNENKQCMAIAKGSARKHVKYGGSCEISPEKNKESYNRKDSKSTPSKSPLYFSFQDTNSDTEKDEIEPVQKLCYGKDLSETEMIGPSPIKKKKVKGKKIESKSGIKTTRKKNKGAVNRKRDSLDLCGNSKPLSNSLSIVKSVDFYEEDIPDKHGYNREESTTRKKESSFKSMSADEECKKSVSSENEIESCQAKGSRLTGKKHQKGSQDGSEIGNRQNNVNSEPVGLQANLEKDGSSDSTSDTCHNRRPRSKNRKNISDTGPSMKAMTQSLSHASLTSASTGLVATKRKSSLSSVPGSIRRTLAELDFPTPPTITKRRKLRKTDSGEVAVNDADFGDISLDVAGEEEGNNTPVGVPRRYRLSDVSSRGSPQLENDGDVDSDPSPKVKKKKRVRRGPSIMTSIDSSPVPATTEADEEKSPLDWKQATGQIPNNSALPPSILKKAGKGHRRMSYSSHAHGSVDHASDSPADVLPVKKEVRIPGTIASSVEPEAPPSGLRRSSRTRVKPLDWFRSERIKYEKRKSGGFVITGIESPRIKEKHKQTREKKKKVYRKKASPWLRRNLSVHEKLTHNFPMVEGPDIPVINPVTGDEVLVDCIKTHHSMNFRGPKGLDPKPDDPLILCKTLTQRSFCAGDLVIRPGQVKDMQVVRNDTLVFRIIRGKIALTIHRSTAILESGDSFFVPQGNAYSIKNLRQEDAILYFFQLKCVG